MRDWRRQRKHSKHADSSGWWNLFKVVIVCIIIIIVSTRRNKDKRTYGEIKAEYEVNHVDDNTKLQMVDSTTLECPMNLNKYSYTFFLEISNFYCNTGYWKCLLMHGSIVDNKNFTKCQSVIQKQTSNETTLYKTHVTDNISSTDKLTLFNSKLLSC